MIDFTKCSREELVNYRPQSGNALIYRYYDNDGSYIGQTIKSLASRAGKDGKYYNHGKFGTAIGLKGFRSFNVEILEECLISEADAREIFYISQFNSAEQGYNSTTGGNHNRSQDGVGDMPEFNTLNRQEFLELLALPDHQIHCYILEEQCADNLIYFAGMIETANNPISPNHSFFFHGMFSRIQWHFNEEKFEIQKNDENTIQGSCCFRLCGRPENFYDNNLYDSDELPLEICQSFAKEVSLDLGQYLSSRIFKASSETEFERLGKFQQELVSLSYTNVVGTMRKENIAPAWMLTWCNAKMTGTEIMLNNTSFIRGYIYFEGMADCGYHVVIRDHKEICALDDESPLLKLKPRDFAKEAEKLQYDKLCN
jgi:hypothetical protein